MRTVPLEIVKDHLIGRHRGRPALFDTGSPMTMRAPAMVSEELGRRVDWIVGNDVLGAGPFIIDRTGHRLILNAPDLPGNAVPLRGQLGLYRTDIEIERLGTHEALLHTGAPLSYGPAGAFSELTPIARRMDFHPVIGRFDTDVYRLSVSVAGRSFECQFGEVPEQLRMVMPLAGSDGWILGADFFRDRAIRLDYGAARLVDVTVALPELDGVLVAAQRQRKMMDAYRAAERILRTELSDEDRRTLSELGARDVIIVQGGYDRVEDVFRLAGIRHTVVAPDAVAQQELNPEQLVIINCPGNLDPAGIDVVRRFVDTGGTLITTDWALKNVIERAFPGFIAHNGGSTRDEVVGVEVFDASHAFLAGLFNDRTDPRWWLEGASYPITILDHDRVRVLLASGELEARHGAAPVAVTFQYGAGAVLHMISHYYLQRAELRTARHKATWGTYAAELKAGAVAAAAPVEWEDLTVGEVEAAHTSLKFMTNVLLEKRRRSRE